MLGRRIVFTGLGAVTPLGNSLEDTWQGLCRGRSGVAPITRFDCSAYETRIAGEVKNFDPLAFIGKKEVRRYDPFIVYALAAAAMALEDASLPVGEHNAERTGVVIGSAVGGISVIERAIHTVASGGPDKLSPFTIPGALCNLAAGQVSIKYGAKGPINCTVTACAAGSNAIGEAARIIARGDADAMIAGGAEAAICSLSVAGFNAMRAISTRNDAPEKASRPFDLQRDGFVIGEGAGIVILEELQHALARGARIYAELVGYASTSDAYHMAAPSPGHAGAARCMLLALRDGRVDPGEVDYVNAHGTATQINDAYETEAIKKVFGSHAGKMSISSTKSMTGHMLGAAGAVEAAFTARSIYEKLIPPTINLDHPDPECDLDYVPLLARRGDIRAAISNSFGFGGANAVLVFRKFEG